MTSEHGATDEREQRWGAVLVTCLKALESGPAVDPKALAAAHPEFAAELTEFLAQREHVQRLAAPLWSPTRAAAGTRRGVQEDTSHYKADAAGEPALGSFG